jgi:hypothetical protein
MPYGYGTTPNIHGHTQSGAPQTRTSALITSTRSHEGARWRSPRRAAARRPELAGSTTRPPLGG